MNLPIRRFLYITFIAAFFIITALLIIYANGYQFSLSNKKFVRTGMFIFDSQPQGATVYLNGKPQATLMNRYIPGNKNFLRTPAKIKNLTPGEYEVRFEKDGYWTWQKKLFVYPSQSTYAEDVILFKKELPLPLSAGSQIAISYSPNKKYVASWLDGQAIIVNLENAETIYPGVYASQTLPIIWSNDNNHLLFGRTIITLDAPDRKIDLESRISQDKYNLKFDPQANNLIYSQSDNQLYQFDRINQTVKPLLSVEGRSKNFKISDYLIKDNKYYVVSDDDKTSNLEIFKKTGERITKITLPSSKTYHFINPEYSQVGLIDDSRGRMLMLNQSSATPIRIDTVNNIRLSTWPSSNQMLIANDFEISFYDLGSRESKIITRISTPINQILWHPSDNYMIYSTENSIRIIELDERAKHNVTELIKLDKISSLELSSDGKSLYFYAEIGNQKGIYQLGLQ